MSKHAEDDRVVGAKAAKTLGSTIAVSRHLFYKIEAPSQTLEFVQSHEFQISVCSFQAYSSFGACKFFAKMNTCVLIKALHCVYVGLSFILVLTLPAILLGPSLLWFLNDDPVFGQDCNDWISHTKIFAEF